MYKLNNEEFDAIRKEAMGFAGIGLYRYTFDGTVLFMDRGTLKILDLEDKFPDTSDVAGKNISELLNYIVPRGAFREKVRKHGHVKGLEYPFQTLGGVKKWVIHDSYLVYDKNLNEDVIQVIIHDITDLKIAEELLEAEKERLTVTLRSIGEGVITTDIEGNILLVNKAGEELTGWKQEEASGKHISEIFNIINANTREKSSLPLDRVLRTGKIFSFPARIFLISRDGRERLISESISPIFDRDNKIIGFVIVFRDITEKVELEEELFKARKLESVGVLASGIAHEFNNILTGVMGNISLAKMYINSEEKPCEILSEAEKGAVRARTLTYQLLTFAKAGSPLKTPASVAELLKQITNLVLSGSNVKSEFFIDNDLWHVEIDTGQISQVISNLILNARQAMPEGGTVQVTAGNIFAGKEQNVPLKPGKYVKIAIKDHGVGISKKNLERIFDPYFTTKKEGSGLGLSATYSLIKKHNGYITAESKVRAGTTFYIYLPACHKDVMTVERQKDNIVTGKGKVLLLDDEDTVRTVTGKILHRLGYNVEFARNGAEAIEMYKKAKENGMPFDSVIMDLTIPGGIGGKEAIQDLVLFDPEIKAIVSSGYTTDSIVSDYRKYGFSAFIAKPYKLSELSETLHDVINTG
ncbi:MAG: PAS domain S-box protein [Candidatus Eremiobacterota bacterium]